MANPQIEDSAGNTSTLSGAADASGNFATAHLPATTAFLSASGPVATSATAGQATLLVPFSAARRSVTICNRPQLTSEVIDVGPAGVVSGGGLPIVAGGDRTFTGPGAAGPIYVVSPNASTPVSWVDM